MKTVRSFVAIELPDPVKASISETQKSLSPHISGARWAAPAGIHLTLKFLGESPAEKIDEIKSELSTVKFSRFEISFGATGVFPDASRAKVLWLGLDSGAEQARELFGQIEYALEQVGFPRESRSFSPHITLARFREPCRIGSDQIGLRRHHPSMPCGEFVLFRSVLQPSGAVYTPLARFACSSDS